MYLCEMNLRVKSDLDEDLAHLINGQPPDCRQAAILDKIHTLSVEHGPLYTRPITKNRVLTSNPVNHDITVKQYNLLAEVTAFIYFELLLQLI